MSASIKKRKLIMNANKNAELESMKIQSRELFDLICKETDDKTKRRMIAKREKLQRKIMRIETGSLLSRSTKRNLVAYSFIAPNFIGFAVFTLIPIIFAFLLAFMNWDGSNPIEWVGLANFAKLTTDTFFKASLKNTIIYVVGTVPLTMVAALALAIVLNQKVRFRGFFRTVAFFPYVASLVAITSVWSMLFHPSKGPINYMLYTFFHVPQEKLPSWFAGEFVLFTMILFSVWKFMGYYMVIYLAGLQGISNELYEAGSLDGANSWQKFWYITLPQLRSTTFFVVVMITINSFKVYDIAVMLAGGGDGKLTNSASVLVYYIYQNAFGYWDLGYSSAIAMVLFVIVLTVTLVQFSYQKKIEA